VPTTRARGTANRQSQTVSATGPDTVLRARTCQNVVFHQPALSATAIRPASCPARAPPRRVIVTRVLSELLHHV
jgi:hypothetical protein